MGLRSLDGPVSGPQSDPIQHISGLVSSLVLLEFGQVLLGLGPILD